jgi:hypothetical protein
MKGKKTDPEFVSTFIQQCVDDDCVTPKDMIGLAQFEIADIDAKLLEVERLKIRRSKLLDVIATLQKADKPDKSKEINQLPLYQVQHPEIAKCICCALEEGNCTKRRLDRLPFGSSDLNFCLKQLSQLQVIHRVGDTFVPGHNFNDFVETWISITANTRLAASLQEKS